MSKTITDETETPTLFESDLYAKVEAFFADEKQCSDTGSATSSPISLEIFGSLIHPDVYGVSNPLSNDFRIFMAEGKLNIKGRQFDICKGQALTLQRFADYVYLFFPEASWSGLEQTEKDEIVSECQTLRIGLLLVGATCQVVEEAAPNLDLLKEARKQMAKDQITRYFPNWPSTDDNQAFFPRYTELADSILKESSRLMDFDLVRTFTDLTPVSNQTLKPWYRGETFELFFVSKVKKGDILLIMYPFGSNIYNTKVPTLLIQERYKSTILKDKAVYHQFVRRFNHSLGGNYRIEMGDSLFHRPAMAQDVINHLEATKPASFSIFKNIDILGERKEDIKVAVENIMREVVAFTNSL